MQMARDKIDAWKAYAEDDGETIAGILEKRKSDPTIWRLYVKVADDGVDQLEHYVLTEGLGDTGARAALLEAYEGLNSKKMTTVRKGYRSELLMNFMLEESFVSGFSEIPKVKEAKKLIKTLEEAYGTISAYQEMIAVLDSAGRIGEVDTKVMSRAMEIAEQNEDDAILQYLAAYIVAAGAADGREYYYQRAVPLVVSFLELSANDKKISDEELALRQTSAIELLTTLQGYQEIVDLIDEMDLDKEDEEAMGALRLFCLLNSGSSEEVYEAAAEMVDEGSEEPQIWYYYGVGALEQGDTDAMNEAMETIMEMVMDEDLSDKELLRAESALYIMIEYATLNESSILAKNNFYHTMSEREQKQYSPLLHSYLEAMDAYANGNDHYPDMDRYEYAKQQIDEVLEERDDLCFAWYLKGCICYRAQQFEEAIEYFEEALSYDPENIQILYALANAYDGAGDYENAYAISTQVEKLWPKKNHAEDPFGIGFHNPNLKNRLEPYVNGGDE
jgi:tetratricopeptide (TPR) repeat protein